MAVINLGKLSLLKGAFVVMEIRVVEAATGKAETTPLTATNDSGDQCFCLFSEEAFAERARQDWSDQASTVHLDSPEAIINTLNGAIRRGIKYVILDYQSWNKLNSLIVTVDEVISACRDARGRKG